MLDTIKKIHFIGIGGVGMSALAYVLIKRGYHVSGSDAHAGYMAAKLAQEGATVFVGHAACQLEGAEAIVVSSAIHQDNVELVEARKRQIPVLHRSDILAYLLNKHTGVAVAGAHGKTTTSSMLACITYEAGIDPTVVIGGVVNSLGGNALNGQSDIVVAEADESDGSFLKFYPQLEVVTNIENDHLDHYGSLENIQKSFAQFLDNLKENGKAVLCLDNVNVRKLAETTTKQYVTYGIDSEDADYQARNIVFNCDGTSFEVYQQGKILTAIHLVVPGKHNVLNALGAFVTAREMGIADEKIVASLAKFAGAKRRFETKGRINGIWVVDDYAHHPTEIKVTLKAATQTQPQRLICVFQPHRYSRTQLLMDEFAVAFRDCDELLLADIYAASEDPIPGITSETLAERIQAATGQRVQVIHTLAEIEAHLAQEAKRGDLIMTIGAGDVYTVGEKLVQELAGR